MLSGQKTVIFCATLWFNCRLLLEENDPLFSSKDYWVIPRKTNSSNYIKKKLLACRYKIHFLLVLNSYFFFSHKQEFYMYID